MISYLAATLRCSERPSIFAAPEVNHTGPENRPTRYDARDREEEHRFEDSTIEGCIFREHGGVGTSELTSYNPTGLSRLRNLPVG